MLPLLLGSACLTSDQPAEGDEELELAASASSITFEAENAVVVGAKILSSSPGFTGTGYVDYQNASGDYVEWTVMAGVATSHPLTFRYANGSTARPLALRVNGTLVNGSLSFPATGSWTTWKTLATTAGLKVGANTIRLTATGSNGPNLDNLVLGSPAVPPPPPWVEVSASSPSEDSTPTWTWFSGGGTGSGTFRYKLDSTDFSTGTTTTTDHTFTPLPLANGVHAFYVQEKSADGQWSPTSVGSGVDVQVHLPYVKAGQQAEKATFSGPLYTNNYPGFSGNGYLDFQNASNDYIEFSPVVPKDGIYKISFVYANGGTTSRPLKVTVNGVIVKASLAFPPTGSWTTWKTLNVDLPIPVNGKLRMTAIGSSGGNFDLILWDSGIPPAPAPVVQGPPSTTTGPMTFSWTSSDPDGTGDFQYRLNPSSGFGPWKNTSGRTVTFTGYPLDEYTFQVQEWNKWGAWGYAGIAITNLVNPGPPITEWPPNPTDPLSVHFAWTSGGGQGLYRYRFNNIGSWEAPTTNTSVGCTCYYPPGATQIFQVEELDKSGIWWSVP